MTTGEKIKECRSFRNMTQKELGIAIDFPESSADIRIAQYETGIRKPKETILSKIADTLDVSIYYLQDNDTNHDTRIVETLFDLQSDCVEFEIIPPDLEKDENNPTYSIKLIPNGINEDLKEWYYRNEELKYGVITKTEYWEWFHKWPLSKDDCGYSKPIKQWQNREKVLKRQLDAVGFSDFIKYYSKFKEYQDKRDGIVNIYGYEKYDFSFYSNSPDLVRKMKWIYDYKQQFEALKIILNCPNTDFNIKDKAKLLLER